MAQPGEAEEKMKRKLEAAKAAGPSKKRKKSSATADAPITIEDEAMLGVNLAQTK